MFPLNTWYVAATPAELGDKPLGRTICNLRMVFFRGPDGAVAALDDFCPHRGAPLSLGRVCEGHVVCGYHGLQMGCDGKTVAMPGQRVGGFPSVRSFPAVERHGFIWVWPGDAALADAALIPHFAWAEGSGTADGNASAGWAFGGGRYHIQADYRLMIDNLMDLTHENYVHSSSIGQKEIDEAPCTTRVEGNSVFTTRHMQGVMAPPFWRMALRSMGLPDDQPVDRWQICHYTPPSFVMIEVGVALAGKGGFDAPAEFKASGLVVDIITPETETTHWYHWGMARRFRTEDAAFTEEMRQAQGGVFAEDRVVLERQQANLLHFADRRLLKLNIDSGGVHARRVLDRMLAAERAQQA
jgi:vanillate O-demethylase monooxygenase subunit